MSSLIWARATDLEHGQFATFARSGMERSCLLTESPKRRRTDWGQYGHATARNVSIKRISQDDLLNLSGLFITKLSLAAEDSAMERDNMRTPLSRRPDLALRTAESNIGGCSGSYALRQRG
jgi:hypothetical protein